MRQTVNLENARSNRADAAIYSLTIEKHQRTMFRMPKEWSVYILRCKDNSLYCGIALDVEKRLKDHETGKGAKYTRGRSPLTMVYQQYIGSHSDAIKREFEIKKMSKQYKEKLIMRS